jgi:DNA polymerase-3 subunit delta
MKIALRRFSRRSVDAALSHAALIDRVIKGIAKGSAWDEFLKLGLELKHGR